MITSARAHLGMTQGSVPSVHGIHPHWFECPLMLLFQDHLVKYSHLVEKTSVGLCQDLWFTQRISNVLFTEMAECDVDQFVGTHYPSMIARNVGKKRASIRKFQEFVEREAERFPAVYEECKTRGGIGAVNPVPCSHCKELKAAGLRLREAQQKEWVIL